MKTGAARCKQATGNVVEDEDGHQCFDDYLYMNGSTIFNFTLEAVPAMMKEILEKNQIKNMRILTASLLKIKYNNKEIIFNFEVVCKKYILEE